MNTAVIQIRTDPKLKMRAQKVARELGFSLSALMNGYMRHLTRTKTVHYTISQKRSLQKEERPSKFLLDAIAEANEDRKKKRYYSFSNPDDAVAFLRKLS